MDAPAGWYPDPQSGEHLRYWAGAAWTDQATVAPAPPSGSEVPGEAPSVGPAPIAPPPVRAHVCRPHRGSAAWRGYVLVGVVAATVGGLGVALATRAAPRTAAAIASAFMSSMAARMRETGCEPPAI